MSKGILKIVATPIGNMGDITLRAIETLKTADLVLSEDTRETDKLLKRLNITAKQISYRDENHNRVFDVIKSYLDDGRTLVLVSDSGTPLISDPGYKLVSELLALDYAVEAIPGPSSVIAALVVSGLPTDKFSFLGFLPRDKGPRIKLLSSYGATESTLVIFESPYRVAKLLDQTLAAVGDRECALVNDITKKFEKVWRGKVSKVLSDINTINLKGEFIFVLAKDDYGR